jgi:hypothetical protein
VTSVFIGREVGVIAADLSIESRRSIINYRLPFLVGQRGLLPHLPIEDAIVDRLLKMTRANLFAAIEISDRAGDT